MTPPSPLRAALKQSWSAFHPLPALYCAPCVVLALVAGLMAGQPGAALLAAAGAFSVGFGAFQQLTRFHLAPMLLAGVCMALSTVVGTAISGNPALDAVAVALAAFSLGLAGSFGTGPWWVLLQGAIFLVISGAHPGSWSDGLSRGAVVLAGGLAQAAVVTVLRRLFPQGFPPLSGPNAAPPPETLAAWRAQALAVLSPRAPEFRYALLLGLAAGGSILIARVLSLANGYWATLTVLLVLRRGGAETLARAGQRVGGTLIGAAVATLVAAVLRPDTALLVGPIGLCAWAAYATQWVNYGTFSTSVTGYVAFLMAVIGLPEVEVAAHRILATLLGGAIGVAALMLAHLGRQARGRLTRRLS